MTSHLTRPGAIAIALLLVTLYLTGCASALPEKTDKPAEPFVETHQVFAADIPVVRYGRYTLVEITPEQTQRDLLTQVIDVSIPVAQGMTEASVGDAMHYVLQRSGYRLCESALVFDSLPLPVAHNHLGPITLRDALMTLAGSVWTLHIDEMARQVCFISVLQHTENLPEGSEAIQ